MIFILLGWAEGHAETAKVQPTLAIHAAAEGQQRADRPQHPVASVGPIVLPEQRRDTPEQQAWDRAQQEAALYQSKRQADAAWWQVWTQIVGSVLILLTLVANAIMASTAMSATRIAREAEASAEQNIKIARRSAKAARDSAQAAWVAAKASVAAELPIIRVHPPEDLLHVDGVMPPEGPYGGSVLTGTPGKFSAISAFEVSNLGRTPAFPSVFRVGWAIAADLPPEPHYSLEGRVPVDMMIEATKGEWELRSRVDFHHAFEATKDEVEAMESEAKWLWVFVSLAYADFQGSPHEARFCWKWCRPDGVGSYLFEWDRGGGPSYTRKT